MRHPEVMIEAMVDIKRAHPDALLVLVGDSQNPGERAWLESEIDRHGVRQHALITGWMAPQQAWRYLRAATIGLSPFPRSRTLEVASPTKVCEYLAYGIPVVANDQPDQAALLEQTGGGLCVPLTAQGFAQGVCALLADPQRARAMARQGRARIGQLRSYDVLAQQLAAQYRRLLGRGADGGLRAARGVAEGAAP
jgi:glycosyltransferase involved in cell wall biosynthesis